MTTRSAALSTAIAVLEELGWHGRPLAELVARDLGAAAQRRILVDGLERGSWWEWVELGEGATTTRAVFEGIDEDAVALAAIRAGVGVPRTAELIGYLRELPMSTRIALLHAHGPGFAEDVLTELVRTTRREFEHEPSWCAELCCVLVDELDVPVPAAREYLKDWIALVCAAFGDDRWLWDTARAEVPVRREVLTRRAVEHAELCARERVPATGPLIPALRLLLDADLLRRDDLVRICFIGIDRARRPGDRLGWSRLLIQDLAVTTDELAEHADVLIPVLMDGTGQLVSLLAVPLAAGPQRHLPDLLAVAQVCRTDGARSRLLRAMAARPVPPADILDACALALAELDAARLSETEVRLIREAWALPGSPPPVQERPDEVLVPWPPTPAVWTVPRLEAPPTSASGILELAQELQADGPWTANPTSERFLAGLVRADATARAAVLQELAGIHEETPVHGLDLVPALHSTPYTPRHDRVGELAEHLDQVTELVSTPTWVDHRLDPEDLVARLESLQRAGGVVLRSDLHLALRRLDLRAPDHDLAVRLRELDVPVICGADKVPDLTAGALAAAIADEPLIEPPLEDGGRGFWRIGVQPGATTAAGLRPRTLRHAGLVDPDDPSPWWVEVPTFRLGSEDFWGRASVMTQLARRAEPFGPAGAMAMIGALRDPASQDEEAAWGAVLDAWDRGLLRPGVASLRYLGWETTPARLASLARVLRDLSSDGLAPVAWPLLDDIAGYGATARRVPPGIAEAVVALDELLASALAAGRATLPGVRSLAARGGTSAAVRAARALTARLDSESGPAPEVPAR